MAANMKLKLDVNLMVGPGRLILKGVYENEGIPQELMDEFKVGSRHITELPAKAVPNVSKAEGKVSQEPVVSKKPASKPAPRKPSARAAKANATKQGSRAKKRG